MSTTSPQQPVPLRQPPPSIRWRTWPARDSALSTLAVVVGLVAVAVVVRWVSGRSYLGLLAASALVVALWRFFLPVEFELSAAGVDQRVFRRVRRIPWRAIRQYKVCKSGVLLLPDNDPSPLASFRGLYLAWSAHRDEVLAHVRYHLERPREESNTVARD